MGQIRATNLRSGKTILFNGEPYVVVDFTHVTPGKGNALVHADLQHMRNKKIISNRFRSTDTVEEIYTESMNMQFLYTDNAFAHFMNTEDYHQIEVPLENISAISDLLKENMELEIIFYGEDPVDFRLPSAMVVKVIETVPGVKGNTVSNVYKPARVETGLMVQVPLFINEGEEIKIDTRTKEYLSRA